MHREYNRGPNRFRSASCYIRSRSYKRYPGVAESLTIASLIFAQISGTELG